MWPISDRFEFKRRVARGMDRRGRTGMDVCSSMVAQRRIPVLRSWSCDGEYLNSSNEYWWSSLLRSWYRINRALQWQYRQGGHKLSLLNSQIAVIATKLWSKVPELLHLN